MTVLQGKPLLKYLRYLKSETQKKVNQTNGTSVSYLAYSQMHNLLNAEIEFLKYMNSNGKTKPTLAITLKGLPSTSSLNADLEKMCEIAEKEPMFAETTKKFKNASAKKDQLHVKQDGLYKMVDETKWNRALKRRKKENPTSQISVQIKENSEKKFNMFVLEEIYVQGYDTYAKEHPILIRESESSYNLVWNRLVDEINEKFYIPNLSDKSKIIPKIENNKKFEDIRASYPFKKKNYFIVKGCYDKKHLYKKGLTRKFWVPNDYAKFLEYGLISRQNITNQLIKILKSNLGEIRIECKNNDEGYYDFDMGKKDLEKFLKFKNIPFANAPKIIPKREDLHVIGEFGNIKSNKFDFILNLENPSAKQKIGIITYTLPHMEPRYSWDSYGGSSRKRDGFNFGKVEISVFKDAITYQSQFEGLGKDLGNLKIN